MYRGAAVGIFSTLIEDGDEYEILAPKLCLGYYTEHSASKFISSTYQNIITMAQENPSIDKTAEIIMGEMIRAKFKDKWTKIYRALITTTYDPLEEYTHHEEKSGTNDTTKTYDTRVESNGNSSTKETTTTNNSVENDVFGYNSVAAVGLTVDNENTTETVEGSADDNTTHNTQDKTGTDSNENNYTDEIDNFGREAAPATLLKKELTFRDEFIFADIIYKDIDSILCLNIY